MKKYILSSALLVCLFTASAQTPDDALRYSYFPQHGSARQIAVGGAMGSLGGDISTLFVNPAGLAFFKTKEYVFSPGIILNYSKANYRGTDTSIKRNGFDLGIAGLVVGFKERGSKWTSQAFGIGVNQTANFNNNVYYKGFNNVTSQSQLFADEFAASGQSIKDFINDPRNAYGAGLAVYSSLVDTFHRNSPNADSIYVQALPEFILRNGMALKQEKRIETRGGIYELAFGYAANMDDKLYLGGTVGVPIVNYTRRSTYRESDTSGITNNMFDYFQIDDTLSTKGIGVNLKLGMIYKPKEFIRLGFTIHTPTFYSLTDKQTTSMTTHSENRYTNSDPVVTVSSRLLSGGQGRSQYIATTPWRLMASGSYVFREIKDTRKQRAFITADIEYVGYGGTRFNPDGENVEEVDRNYYKEVKEVIKDYYKGAFNYRLGGELKFNTIMFRLGGAYYSSPYREKEFKSSIMQATGGLGYRNHGMFIDLTYAHSWMKDVNIPYRLAKNTPYAFQTNQRGNIVMTLGFKF
jgi:hypothetical protein